jgi:hypothetical protein
LGTAEPIGQCWAFRLLAIVVFITEVANTKQGPGDMAVFGAIYEIIRKLKMAIPYTG